MVGEKGGASNNDNDTKKAGKKQVLIALIVLLLTAGSIVFVNSLGRVWFCVSLGASANLKNILTGQCKRFGNPCNAPWYYVGSGLGELIPFKVINDCPQPSPRL